MKYRIEFKEVADRHFPEVIFVFEAPIPKQLRIQFVDEMDGQEIVPPFGKVPTAIEIFDRALVAQNLIHEAVVLRRDKDLSPFWEYKDQKHLADEQWKKLPPEAAIILALWVEQATSPYVPEEGFSLQSIAETSRYSFSVVEEMFAKLSPQLHMHAAAGHIHGIHGFIQIGYEERIAEEPSLINLILGPGGGPLRAVAAYRPPKGGGAR